MGGKLMKLIDKTTIKTIVADEGKHIRSANDTYFKNEEEEHFPYYTTIIFVPLSFTEEQMNELYVEEEINE
jgi:hypothetical protein